MHFVEFDLGKPYFCVALDLELIVNFSFSHTETKEPNTSD